MAGTSGPFEASTTASNGTGGRSSPLQTCVEAEAAGELAGAGGRVEQVDLRAVRTQEQGREHADRAQTENQGTVPGPACAACAHRSALPPGSTRAPRTASTVAGSACSDRTGTASCSASAPGRPPRMPTSSRWSQTCCCPRRQRRHVPSPIIVSPVTRRPDPRRIDALPHLGDHARPLVAEAHRVRRVALVEVGHLAGEELDVGAADADPFDVDDRLARRRRPGGGTSSTWYRRGPSGRRRASSRGPRVLRSTGASVPQPGRFGSGSTS